MAATREGVRIGKGGGYSEIEYGVLRALNLIDEETPVFTTVHDIQIVAEAPREEHDFLVDAIITPTTVIRVDRLSSQPKGIMWERLTQHQLETISILQELRSRGFKLEASS